MEDNIDVPIIIGTMPLLVAILAFTVASEKFRLDLYNKRFDIYVRTVRFYQALMSSKNGGEAFSGLRKDFVLAVREPQFLLAPTSGIHALLSQLNTDSLACVHGAPIAE